MRQNNRFPSPSTGEGGARSARVRVVSPFLSEHAAEDRVGVLQVIAELEQRV